MAGSSEQRKILMETEDLEEKENRLDYTPPSKGFILEDNNYYDHFLGDFLHYPTREAKSRLFSTVKAPKVEQYRRLPKSLTYPHQHARLFTKAAGANEGVIQLIGSQRARLSVPLDPLHDYKVLHVRQDGWVVFLRKADMSIAVYKVVDPTPQNLVHTPPIVGIRKGKIFSGSLIGEVSLGSLEIFLIGAGVVENQPCGLLIHLGRGESSWVITRFSSAVPTKAVGPLLLEGGVLMAIIDGFFLFTFNMHDFSASRSVLGGFQRMGNCTLLKGTRGSIFAMQISGLLEAAPIVHEIERGENWLVPIITHFEEPALGSCYLTKNDVGFMLSGDNVCYVNCIGDQHLWFYLNGVWEGVLHAHPGCSCTGGFLH